MSAAARREVAGLLEHATQVDPGVFMTVEDVRSTNRLLVCHAPRPATSPASSPPKGVSVNSRG